MSRMCSSFRKIVKISAIVLMAVGLLLLVCFLPGWAWGTALGIALISIGFLAWRYLAI